MWLLMIIGAYLCGSINGDAFSEMPIFHKCCQKNQVFIREIDDAENRELYECLDSESIEKDFNIAKSPLIVGDSVPVKYGNPNETLYELELVQLTSEETDIRPPTSWDDCYDRVVLDIKNGTISSHISRIVKLTSNKTTDMKLFALGHIQKCCPKGYSYDTVNHLCKKGSKAISEELLFKRLNVNSSLIYEVETGLHCKPDQFAVEFIDEFNSLEVEDSTLTVSKKNGGGGGHAFEGEWCVEQDYRRPGLVARACSQDCAAYGAFCVRKCCPVGQYYKKRHCGSPISDCVSDDEEIPFEISKYMKPLNSHGIGDIIGIRSELRCKRGTVVLNHTPENDCRTVDKYGNLHWDNVNYDEYCLEVFDNRHCNPGDIYATAAICFIPDQGNKQFITSFWLISISSVCLALTLIVYCSLPELRNLHGKILICHVSMMLLAFICLARAQYGNVSNTEICTTLGYGIYFGFIAAFAWLNVMCYDIWCTFSSMRTVQSLKTSSTRRRFLYYSLYAWGTAIVMTFTLLLFDMYPVTKFLDANIGSIKCWFSGEQNSTTDWPHYIFFVIPMALGTCTNFVLFMMTARHCARVKSEVHRLQAGSVGDSAKKRFRVDRANYVLTGKLWVVMGAGWIFEVAATLIAHPVWLWSIMGLFNELQGVFIFLILVFKPKLYHLIRKRLGMKKLERKNKAQLTLKEHLPPSSFGQSATTSAPSSASIENESTTQGTSLSKLP